MSSARRTSTAAVVSEQPAEAGPEPPRHARQSGRSRARCGPGRGSSVGAKNCSVSSGFASCPGERTMRCVSCQAARGPGEHKANRRCLPSTYSRHLTRGGEVFYRRRTVFDNVECRSQTMRSRNHANGPRLLCPGPRGGLGLWRNTTFRSACSPSSSARRCSSSSAPVPCRRFSCSRAPRRHRSQAPTSASSRWPSV